MFLLLQHLAIGISALVRVTRVVDLLSSFSVLTFAGQYTDANNTVYNFATIAKRTIFWQQQVADVTNGGDGSYDLFNYADLSPAKYSFEVSICGAVG